MVGTDPQLGKRTPFSRVAYIQLTQPWHGKFSKQLAFVLNYFNTGPLYMDSSLLLSNKAHFQALMQILQEGFKLGGS